MSSSSDTDLTSADEIEANKPALEAAFRGYKALTFISIFGEVLFVWSVYSWQHQFKSESDFFLPGQGKAFVDEQPATWMINVFLFTIVARGCLIICWRRRLFTLADSQYGSLFMFFSTMQWVYYLTTYYHVSEQFTGVVWQSKVQVTAVANNNYFRRSKMGECLIHHHPIYCRTHLHDTIECTEEFNNTLCSGYTLVGHMHNLTKCCVRKTFGLERPKVLVWILNIPVATMFSILQWIAALAMKWALECSPFFDVSKTASFTDGCTMDILDAVIFAQYLLDDRVLYPMYGILLKPKGDAGEKQPEVYNAVFATWLTGITLAVLSPVIYNFLRARNVTQSDKSKRSFEGAADELLQEIRMLRRSEASKLVEEAVELQSQEYTEQLHMEDGVPVAVTEKVLSKEEKEMDFLSSELSVMQRAWDQQRTGIAKKSAGSTATYHVMYDDGQEPVEEHRIVHDLEPDFDKYGGAFGPSCCSGWCAVRRLFPRTFQEESRAERFEARAEVLDAFRSLVFLELPFLMWRIWFERGTVSIDSFAMILMAKNLLWGFMDLLTILSCGNRSATFFGASIMKDFETFIRGSAVGSVWVGPAGIFRIAADTVFSSVKMGLAHEKERLQLKKAWLLVERARLPETSKEAMADYDLAIEQTSAEMSVLEQKAARAHY
eukprot:TRINITY_DN93803_c0_g1_i1.p1 TRINITY_DN93803_c0_g1~~TRINITY_DN93803_c0_g1_i1.p1  ORF type:complete len:662 (-),score=113.30 TRINITY_DN93803_c0_g1_i1:80-2065(-)